MRLLASEHEVGQLVRAWRDRNKEVLDFLPPLFYCDFHLIAEGLMAWQRHNYTLQTTTQVNHACLRLADVRRVNWQGRAYFLAIYSRSCLKRSAAMCAFSLKRLWALSARRRQDFWSLIPA